MKKLITLAVFVLFTLPHSGFAQDAVADNDKYLIGVGVMSAVYGPDHDAGNSATFNAYGGVRLVTLNDGTKFHILGQHVNVPGSSESPGLKAMVTTPMGQRGDWRFSLSLAGGWLWDFARDFTETTDKSGTPTITENSEQDSWNADVLVNIVFNDRIALTPSLHIMDRGENPADPNLARKPAVGLGLNLSMLVAPK